MKAITSDRIFARILVGDTQSEFVFIISTASQTSSPTPGKFLENMALNQGMISPNFVLDTGTPHGNE